MQCGGEPKPFLKTKDGVRLLIAVLRGATRSSGTRRRSLAILDHACNLLCYLTFHHPETAAAQFMAADGIAFASACSRRRAHYARTLARPARLPSRPPPEAPPAL